MAAVLASGWVAQGPKVAAFEAGLRRPRRRGHGRRRLELHHRAAPRPARARRRARRRGHRPVALVHRHRQLGRATPAPTRCSPTSTSHPEPHRQDDRGRLTAATRAVMVVHQAGMPADLGAIRALCDPRGIAVVEDAACAHRAAPTRARPIGAGSDLAVFSFHPRKIITTGEGGMIVTDDAELGGPPPPAARARHEPERGRPPRQRAAGARAVPRARLQLPHDRHAGRGRPGPARPARRRSSPSAVARWPALPARRSPTSRACRSSPTRPTAPPTSSRSGSLLPDEFPAHPRRAARRAWPSAGISARRGHHGRPPRAGLRRCRTSRCRSPSGSPHGR